MSPKSHMSNPHAPTTAACINMVAAPKQSALPNMLMLLSLGLGVALALQAFG